MERTPDDQCLTAGDDTATPAGQNLHKIPDFSGIFGWRRHGNACRPARHALDHGHSNPDRLLTIAPARWRHPAALFNPCLPDHNCLTPRQRSSQSPNFAGDAGYCG